MFAALHRFVAANDPRPAFRGPDYLAGIFLPPPAKFLLKFRFFHRNIRDKLPGTYEYLTARTLYFDRLFSQALQKNVPQVVLLGAGYDTRAIRFGELLGNSKVIELDAPAAQNKKKKFLQSHGVSLPPGLCLAPITFGEDDLLETLEGVGFDQSKRSFFLWEGVIYYLEEDTVSQTLAFIRDHSGPASSVAFDYFYSEVAREGCDYYGAAALRRSLAKVGEPLRSGIPEGEIENFAARHGFRVLDHLTPSEMERAFLRAADGEFAGKVHGFACLAHLEALPPRA